MYRIILDNGKEIKQISEANDLKKALIAVINACEAITHDREEVIIKNNMRSWALFNEKMKVGEIVCLRR